jgi:hypothetical protein
MKISINVKDKKELLEQIAFVLRMALRQKNFFIGLCLKYWQQGFFTGSYKMLSNNEWAGCTSFVSKHMKIFDKLDLIKYKNHAYRINPEILISNETFILEFNLNVGETDFKKKNITDPYINYVFKNDIVLTPEMITGKIKPPPKIKTKSKRGKRIVDMMPEEHIFELPEEICAEAKEYVNPRYANLL